MNTLIQLKGKLEQAPNRSGGGTKKLTSKECVLASNIDKLIDDLKREKEFWNKQNYFKGALINVYYKRIVPKSKRISYLFFGSLREANNFIKGAKYAHDKEDKNKLKHVITYYVKKNSIEDTINKLNKCNELLKKELNGIIDKESLDDFIKEKESIINKYDLTKSSFSNMIVDCSTIESFGRPEYTEEYNDNQIYTLFNIDDKSSEQLLASIGVKYNEYTSIDKNTVILNKKGFDLVETHMPYIISAQTYDIANFELKDKSAIEENNKKIENQIVSNAISNLPEPNNEPIIGVLDTAFNSKVYFNEWVDYHDEYWNKNIELDLEDYKHGTAVDSIIVDGPALNPDLEDNCGRFRVRHFLVAKQDTNNVITLVRNIQKIVEDNLDIKVWNLSLGSRNEIDENFISHEAFIIDYLEYKYDVIFVISGTNKDEKNQTKIGSPADSINSIVVNSIKRNGEKASYSRKGKVLSFFNKPDICYYGGDKDEEIITINNDYCIYKTKGTSIAAPWISRKMGFLIYKLGLSREIAKALIIDAATGWKNIDFNKVDYYGFGKVPTDIKDIINTPKDEIKFFIEDTSYEYDTYTHHIPVPLSNSQHPFIAKATLCYFPNCDRNSGVDYTNTELDITFGRLTTKLNSKGERYYAINSIVNNSQSDELSENWEEDVRKFNRKWDNVKHLVEEWKPKIKPRKSYENPMWGLSVKTKERLNNNDGQGIKFGVVITLKEINGVNRFEEFIKQCSFRGWLVNRIDIESKLELYNKAEEEIKFE